MVIPADLTPTECGSGERVFTLMYVAQHRSGRGGHSGRSTKLATTIIGQATDDIIDKGRKMVSFLLETREIDIEPGRYLSPALIVKSASSRLL